MSKFELGERIAEGAFTAFVASGFVVSCLVFLSF